MKHFTLREGKGRRPLMPVGRTRDDGDRERGRSSGYPSPTSPLGQFLLLPPDRRSGAFYGVEVASWVNRAFRKAGDAV